MTFAELKNLVSYWVDDLQFGYFTEAQVGRFVNNALLEVQKNLILAGQNDYLDCKETQTVIGQASYVLPQDFLKLNRLEIVTNQVTNGFVSIPGITLNQTDFITTQQGFPRAYYIKKNRLILTPAPDQVYTLRLFYTYEIAELVEDAEVPDVPDIYNECIAIFAAYDCFIKDQRDPGNLLLKRNEYLEMFNSMAAERTVDRSRQIVVRDDEYSGSYF